MTYLCQTCKTEFPSPVKLYNHSYDVHVNTLQVTINKKTSVVERIDGTCSVLSRAEKRRDLETDDDENISSVLIKHHKPSKGEIDFGTDSSVTFQTSAQFDNDTAVLLACNSLSSSPRIQNNCVLAAKIGKLKPILLTSSNGKIYPFLTASDNINDVLSDEPTGTWSLPTVNKRVTEGSSISTNADDLFKHIVSTSPIYRHIADQQYVEFSEQITQEIRSILLSGSTALLINCVESYGRLKTVDSHHERRTGSATHNSSFPKTVSKYGQIAVCLTQDDNTNKQTITNNTIEMGPSTNNFVPLPNTKIYLNTDHLKLGKILLEDETATCIDQSYVFYQLRQLRSKFYCLSTYSLCRSFSSTISDISYRPYTIWTLCEYDSAQTLDSQSHKLSKMFQSIASEVFKNGSAAHIEVMLFHKLHNTLKDGAVKDAIGQIINLQENGLIVVIDNLKLSSLLQTLADSMTTSLKNSNQTAAKLLSQHLYK
ncbi:hypothetical protein BD408DRAFT_446960 [Parasitella parasitica]|nr:hypothetical protein BD408DRAFT_446960 [Parasitella parasitica]